MKKLCALMICLTLVLGIGIPACAETAPQLYQKGDKVDDFAVTLSDGTEVTLYGLLKEKKAVVINFWATYCSPCLEEFPALQAAYADMKDDIALIALSKHEPDTDEGILAYQEKHGFEGIPMGKSVELYNRFYEDGVPFTAVIDRNGVYCFGHCGMIPDKDKLERLFSVYTDADYSEPVLLDEIPAQKSTVEQPADSAVMAALGIEDGTIAWTPTEDPCIWPFVPSEAGDSLIASNGKTKDSTAELTLQLTSKEGEALLFDYQISLGSFNNSLYVDVDGESVAVFKNAADWTTTGVSFAAPGEHTVTFACVHSLYSDDDVWAALRNIRLGSEEEIAAAERASQTDWPAKLEEGDCAFEIIDGETKEILLGSEDDIPNAMGAYLVTSDTMTLRIRLGKDVKDNLACASISYSNIMLTQLPHDEAGYLYTFNKADYAETGAPVLFSIQVFPDALKMDSGINIGMFVFAMSEGQLDNYVDVFAEMAQAQGIDMKMSWFYADGSPRVDAVADQQPASNISGNNTYTILVTDAEGYAVPGAMVQICDDETCRVETTDADGAVKLEMKPYPYEIHLLMAPAGYKAPGQIYTLPKEGGSLTITLEKK